MQIFLSCTRYDDSHDAQFRIKRIRNADVAAHARLPIYLPLRRLRRLPWLTMFPMKLRAGILALAFAASLSIVPAAFSAAHAQQVVPLWPHGTPEPPNTTEPETDLTKPTDNPINGHRTARITNITAPVMTIYKPSPDKDTHTAALVFPGGGYKYLAYTGEGNDTCDWLTSAGITCLLVKYRVPQPPGMAGHYPQDFQDLEDAQQAMRLARAHAREWQIDPAHIGVIGFSAGANLAVLLSNYFADHHVESTPAARDVPGYTTESSGAVRFNATPDARPNFAIVVYPAYLIDNPDDSALNPVYAPSKSTPPTFLIQAKDDKMFHRNAPVYYLALDAASVSAELHMYPTGGHGFGIHPQGKAEEHWTRLADAWLRRIDMLPEPRNGQRNASSDSYNPGTGAPAPCTPVNAPQTNSRPSGSNPTMGASMTSSNGGLPCAPN
jgi:acetyl esterase/lipase